MTQEQVLRRFAPSGRLLVRHLFGPARRLHSDDMKDKIVVRGARQHNLKGFDLEIPRRAFTVITGPSGSGQVLARVRHHLRRGPASVRRVAVGVRATIPRAHGKARRRFDRRPVARRRDRAEESNQDVAIHRRARRRRSTTTCACSGRASATRSARSAGARCGRTPSSPCPTRCSRSRGARAFYVAFPLRLSSEVTHDVVVENLRAQGFVRVVLDGAIKHLDELMSEAIDVTFAEGSSSSSSIVSP